MLLLRIGTLGRLSKESNSSHKMSINNNVLIYRQDYSFLFFSFLFPFCYLLFCSDWGGKCKSGGFLIEEKVVSLFSSDVVMAYNIMYE